ncbi:MAG: hypothetical protein G8345_01630 [Magnetococcales bacterium]|nr:hypothetical protein [Magnetococcales bacterium]NGZ25571.1 hypothetical protein [Magnetococcales bacterium]
MQQIVGSVGTGRVMRWLMVAAALNSGVEAAEGVKMDRNASLLNSFQVFCTLQPPNFSALDQRAKAMQLPVLKDLGESKESGYFTHSKSWIVPLKDGPHQLGAAESKGPNGGMQTCGIVDEKADAEAFGKTLRSALKLDDSPKVKLSADGKTRMTLWQNAFGSNTFLMLVDATPISQPGINLLLSYNYPSTELPTAQPSQPQSLQLPPGTDPKAFQSGQEARQFMQESKKQK